jgi:hypothetical protein
MIYITKYNVGLSFIYRYSQPFSVDSSCHAAGVSSVSDSFPNPMNHVHIYGRNRFCYPVPVVLPNLQEVLEHELCP